MLAHDPAQGPAWCLAPGPATGIPTTTRPVLAAISGPKATARVLAYPVWMWHWAEPGDPRVPWSYARRGSCCPTTSTTPNGRRSRPFETQINPLSDDPADAAILPPHVLARLTRDVEVVFELESR